MTIRMREAERLAREVVDAEMDLDRALDAGDAAMVARLQTRLVQLRVALTRVRLEFRWAC